MAKFMYCLFILLFFSSTLLAQESFKPPCDISGDLSKAQTALNNSINVMEDCLTKNTNINDCTKLKEAQKEVIIYMAALDYPLNSTCYDTAMEWRLNHDKEIDTFLDYLITYDDLATRLLEKEPELIIKKY